MDNEIDRLDLFPYSAEIISMYSCVSIRRVTGHTSLHAEINSHNLVSCSLSIRTVVIMLPCVCSRQLVFVLAVLSFAATVM